MFKRGKFGHVFWTCPCHGSACPNYRMCYNIPFAIKGGEVRLFAKAQFDNFCARMIREGKLNLSGGDK